jgi:hypothetical protein
MSARMTTTWHRGLKALLLVSSFSIAGIGCAPPDPDEEAGDPESAETDVDALGEWVCDVHNLGTKSCQDALSSVKLQAYASGRTEIVERGIDWLNRGVTYDANKVFEGYRRDCSGFVSMTWEYAANPNTALFPPFVTTGQYAIALGSFDDLVPGDALNRTYRNPVGHVMLFAGWATFDHREMFLIHEYSTGKPAGLIQINRSSLQDYIAIRSSKAPAPVAPTEPPPAAPEPPTAGCGKLVPDQALGIDQAAWSCDGRFALVQQSDGNLVLYRDGGSALWSTKTDGSSGQSAVMQGDGNLVLYGPSGAVWSTGTYDHPGAWLAIRDDGSLVINEGDKPIWWNGTGGL